MMGTRSSLFAKIMASIAIAGLSGCASAPRPIEGSAYRESATDVINRAPQSMSLPQEGKDGIVLDDLNLRAKADYHFALAESFALEGNIARAIEEYKTTIVYDPKTPRVRLRLAAEYVKQGLISEAMEQARVAIETDPKNIDAHLLLGGLNSALRVYDEALAEYGIVTKLDPANLEAPMFIGALLAEQKKFTEALAYFDRLAKNTNNPNAHMAWYYVGRVRTEENKEGASAKAEAAYRQALSVKPSYVDAMMALGQIYESTGRKAQTIDVYRGFQEKYGPNAAIAEELSRLYIENKDYSRAYAQFEIMEAADPEDLNPKVKMAFILIEQEKYQEAIVRLEDILARAPASDKVRFYLGAVHEELKDYKSAIAHFEKVPTASSYYHEAVIHASYLYKLKGDYEKAVSAIQAGIKERGDHAPFYALYASLLDDQKHYREAGDLLKGAVEKFPDNAQLRYFLGSVEDKLGDKDAMIVSMKAVLSIDKNHVQALNYLAYSYAERNFNLDEAERMVRRALELQPNDGFVMDTLGLVLFKKGNVHESIRVLEAAYKIQPNESVIAEHLGDAYYHTQMPDKAKKLYQRAAETESNVATIDKLRAKIIDVDRQIQNFGSEGGRRPASAKSR
jgi:tetratricopeptide (TPR) repeat protein